MAEPLIPTVDDFTSAAVIDRFDDMVNPPGLTNHLAVVQVDHDVVAVRSLNVPPVSTGDTVTGQLFLDGRLARSFGAAVECTWRPDQVRRSTVIDGWRVDTVTACPPGAAAVVVRIDITNLADRDRDVTMGLRIESAVTHAGHPWVGQIEQPWASPFSPTADNRIEFDGARRIGTAVDGSASAVQGLVPVTGDWTVGGAPGMLEARGSVSAGGTGTVAFGYAIASG
ncbi:MAG TPA: hypothetical protein VFM01_16265, partial [Nakamurella sp.]|nr:hypothetical protein [Nakamurella sp.]